MTAAAEPEGPAEPSAGPAPVLRPCEHRRCRRKVFDARIFKTRGAPVDVVLDAAGSTWADGARLKLIPGGLDRPLVLKLTQSTIHKAFGVPKLYVEHREVCEVAARRTRQKTTKDIGS